MKSAHIYKINESELIYKYSNNFSLSLGVSRMLSILDTVYKPDIHKMLETVGKIGYIELRSDH